MYPTYQFTAPSSSGGSIASANYDSPLSGLSSGSRDTSTSPPSPDELAQTLGLDDWKDWIDFHDGESDQAAAQPTFFPVLDPQLPVSSPLEFVNLPQAEGLSKAPLLDPLAGVDLSTFPFAATHLPATPTLGGAQAGFLPLQSIPEVAPFTAVPKAPSNFDLAPPLASDAAAFAADDASRLPSKKRKLGSTHEGSASPEEPLDGGDRGSTERNAAHNTVERRYRNRLKDMIATLRDHIPSLQNMDPNEADRGLANQSVTKGLVLTQATQYIVELEARNKKLLDENAMLQRQVMVLGKLNGQLRAQCAALQRPGGGGGGGAMSKVMVGGLAGMLAMQGFSTAETSSDRPTGRGLFAVPVHLLQQGVRYLHGYRLPLIGDAVHLGSAVSLLRGVLLLSAAVYLFLPWVFSAAARPGRPPPRHDGWRHQARPVCRRSANPHSSRRRRG
ncbi:hypothetical protein VTK73DRAFT_4958 [Phialemonium thermophilum]|uniref:BHLH domain-containing protein n=1 Tax=Phialemonium thermophilum TaxID=223376 RepID=A0ABR3V4I4_9PEZI